MEVHVPVLDWDEGLVSLAERLGVDLIATGSHAYGELGRAFTRSVSTAVLHGAACSVLIVPTTGARTARQRASRATSSAPDPVPSPNAETGGAESTLLRFRISSHPAHQVVAFPPVFPRLVEIPNRL